MSVSKRPPFKWADRTCSGRPGFDTPGISSLIVGHPSGHPYTAHILLFFRCSELHESESSNPHIDGIHPCSMLSPYCADIKVPFGKDRTTIGPGIIETEARYKRPEIVFQSARATLEKEANMLVTQTLTRVWPFTACFFGVRRSEPHMEKIPRYDSRRTK
jgi:hypothetical protein